MLRYILYIILSFYFFSAGAFGDSLKAKVRFSLNYNCAFTSVNYIGKFGTETKYYASHYNTSTSNMSSNFSGSIYIPPTFFPELETGFQLPKNFRITIGNFYNEINFVIPEIPSSYKYTQYYFQGGMQNATVDSTVISYASGPTYKDQINFIFLGTTSSIGYSYKKNKFLIDLDLGVKLLYLVNGTITKTENYSQNNGLSLDTIKYNLSTLYKGDDGIWRMEYPSGVTQKLQFNNKMGIAFLKASVGYNIWKNIYYSVGFSYSRSFLPMHGSLDYSYGSGSYKYSIGIQQFSICSGFTLLVR